MAAPQFGQLSIAGENLRSNAQCGHLPRRIRDIGERLSFRTRIMATTIGAQTITMKIGSNILVVSRGVNPSARRVLRRIGIRMNDKTKPEYGTTNQRSALRIRNFRACSGASQSTKWILIDQSQQFFDFPRHDPGSRLSGFFRPNSPKWIALVSDKMCSCNNLVVFADDVSADRAF